MDISPFLLHRKGRNILISSKVNSVFEADCSFYDSLPTDEKLILLTTAKASSAIEK